MVRKTGWTPLALALAGLAAGTPGDLSGQLTPAEAEELRRILIDRPEARVRLATAPLESASFVMLRPRVDAGFLIGEVRTGSVGRADVFESRAFLLDQVREVRIKENRFWRGAIYGAAAGVALAAGLHLHCSRSGDDCSPPAASYPFLYAAMAGVSAGVGGTISFYTTGWRVVHSHSPATLRVAGGRRR